MPDTNSLRDNIYQSMRQYDWPWHFERELEPRFDADTATIKAALAELIGLGKVREVLIGGAIYYEVP